MKMVQLRFRMPNVPPAIYFIIAGIACGNFRRSETYSDQARNSGMEVAPIDPVEEFPPLNSSFEDIVVYPKGYLNPADDIPKPEIFLAAVAAREIEANDTSNLQLQFTGIQETETCPILPYFLSDIRKQITKKTHLLLETDTSIRSANFIFSEGGKL